MCDALRNKEKELERLMDELHEYYDYQHMVGYLESLIAEVEHEIAMLEAEKESGK